MPGFEILDFPTRHIGRVIHRYDQTPSTNDLALALAHDPESAGIGFLARRQTGGRGQYGRVWDAPADSSLLLSVLVFPPAEYRRPAILTAWAAVSIREAIRELTGRKARIKWPNDLLVENRKFCGILIEQAGPGVAVGIGLNVTQSPDDFAVAGLPEAVSLKMIAESEWDPVSVLDSILKNLDETYDQLLNSGPAALEAEWVDGLQLRGQFVTISVSDEALYQGRLNEIGFDGVALDVGGLIPRIWPPESIRGISVVRQI